MLREAAGSVGKRASFHCHACHVTTETRKEDPSRHAGQARVITRRPVQPRDKCGLMVLYQHTSAAILLASVPSGRPSTVGGASSSCPVRRLLCSRRLFRPEPPGSDTNADFRVVAGVLLGCDPGSGCSAGRLLHPPDESPVLTSLFPRRLRPSTRPTWEGGRPTNTPRNHKRGTQRRQSGCTAGVLTARLIETTTHAG